MSHRGQSVKKAQPPDMLDVGIMVVAPSATASINLFLPMTINPSDITDLAPKFQDAALATAIFNENLQSSNGSAAAIITLRYPSGEHHSDVFQFPIDRRQLNTGYINILPESDGTLVTITSAALHTSAGIDGNRRYFRIRIILPGNGANTFINATLPGDKILTSGFDVTEYLDFRLNQARNLPIGVSVKLPRETALDHAQITRLDFLLVTRILVDVVGGHPTFHKCRLLETNLWKEYVDRDHLQRGMVIYHWKEARNGVAVVDFNVFVKLRLRLTERRTILKYLLFALIFGCVIGIIGNACYDGIRYIILYYYC